jgi:tetratricopeptide (TPR) repeat protein
MKKTAFAFAVLLIASSCGQAFAFDTGGTTSTATDAPDLTSVRAKIKAKDYKAALAELTPMIETYQNPDVYNLIGFSLRKSGDTKQAMTFYQKALDFNPEHKGALEYQGELFVEIGQVDKAKQNVVALQKLCPTGCEELADLQKAIAKSETKTN